MTPTPESWCPPAAPSESPQAAARRTPQERGITVGGLCRMGWRPLMLTGLVKDILTRHFQSGNVEESDLRSLVWRDDVRTSILIESLYRWRGDLTEKRPACVVKRNAYQNLHLVIGDRSGITEDGFYEYATHWVGSHTVFCIHGSGAGVDILATEVQRELTQFAPVVKEYLGLFKWVVTEVGEIAKVEEAKESFVVPVTVGWCYEELWRVELESLRLRKIPLSVLMDGATVLATN